MYNLVIGKANAWGISLTLFAIIGFLAALASLWAFVDARAVQTRRTFPKRLWFRVSATTLWRDIERVRSQQGAQLPDVVLGVHYGGMIYAAKFARKFDRPLGMVVTRVEGGAPGRRGRCVSAICRVPPDVQDKEVWLVDNQIWSGETLRLARDAVLDSGAKSVTTVVVHHNGRHVPTYEPEVVLYRSHRRFRHLVL